MRVAADLRAGVVAVALCGAVAACSPAPSTAGTTSTSTSTSSSTTVAASGAAAEIQQAVEAFNAAAGGPVTGQQKVLAGLVDDGQRPVQRQCAAATTTLRFEPIYARLGAAPDWRPSRGTVTGTIYALPTLIRIYTGNRITGTDLTDLHIAVRDGRAWLPALCVG